MLKIEIKKKILPLHNSAACHDISNVFYRVPYLKNEYLNKKKYDIIKI